VVYQVVRVLQAPRLVDYLVLVKVLALLLVV
jgi:hypothetical protein